MRQRETVILAPGEEIVIRQWEDDIRRLITVERCPPVLNKPICKQCSYYDFCYAGENEN